MEELNQKWKQRFLSLAEHISSWSKDPSTQVGAVIVRPNKSVVSLGYNGFPIGVQDDLEMYLDRDVKLANIVHAEMNALVFATEPLHDCTLFVWPFIPCSRCAGPVIQSGIKNIISVIPTARANEKWGESFRQSRLLFRQARVRLEENS